MVGKWGKNNHMESSLKVLIYGYYFKENIGDALFIQAFQYLFPDLNLTFVSFLNEENINNSDLIIFGGGSFLFAPPTSTIAPKELINILKNKKICYIGVGVETDIHSMHQELMKSAKFVATRTVSGKEKLSAITATEIIEMPDLVYALNHIVSKQEPIRNSLLILANAEILPKWNDPQWKSNSWNMAKTQLAEAFDELKLQGYHIQFAPMSSSANMNDKGAAIEIINSMNKRNFNDLINLPEDFGDLADIVSHYETVITQRFHGAILADMCERGCVSLAHHDKLKQPTMNSVTLSYYGLHKRAILEAILATKTLKRVQIKSHSFERVRERVYHLLGAKCQNLSEQKMARYK